MINALATSLKSKLSLKLLQRICQVSGLILSVSLLLIGCSRRYDDMPVYLPLAFDDYPNRSVGRFKTEYLAEQIDRYYRGATHGPLGVTTFVNIDDLYTTSTFGRMLGEQLMSELAMRDFEVIELRHSDALQFLNPNGEFALSRDVSAIRRDRDLGGIIVGTYVVSPLRVYVNARLLDPTSSRLLSAASVEMSKTDEISRLVRGGSVPGTLERIPVRHLGLSTYPLSMFPSYMRAQELEKSDSFGLAPGQRVEPRFSNEAVAAPEKPTDKKAKH